MLARYLIAGAVAVLLPLLGGCGAKQWEITVENQSNSACAVSVKLGADGSGEASVDALAAGGSAVLTTSEGETIVHSVTVKRENVNQGVSAQSITPNAALIPGQRFHITIDAKGKVEGAVSGAK